MKILICEDNEKKYQDLTNFIVNCKISYTSKRTTNMMDTLKEIIDKDYDILIQDMQIPRRENRRIEINGGAQVLKSLKLRGLNIPSIVFTSSEDSLAYLKERDIEVPMAIYGKDWKSKIKGFLEENNEV